MMNRITTCALTILLAVFFANSAFGQIDEAFVEEGQRRAQSGFKFLQVGLDARASALSGAVTSQQQPAAIDMLYNPSAIAKVDGMVNTSLANVQFIADAVYSGGAVTFAPADGVYGVFGFSAVSASYGEFNKVRRDITSDKGYSNEGTYEPGAWAIGVAYARSLTDRFSVGGHLRYARQDLGESIMNIGTDQGGDTFMATQQNTEGTPAFDFGVSYETGFRSLLFSAQLRNFAPELQYEEIYFELPLTFTLGLSMDMTELAPAIGNAHDFMLTVDGSRPRDYDEHINFGGEYQFMDILSLRGGYSYPNDTKGVSLGGGLNFDVGGTDLSVDYAYTQYSVFGSVNRFSLNFGL